MYKTRILKFTINPNTRTIQFKTKQLPQREPPQLHTENQIIH